MTSVNTRTMFAREFGLNNNLASDHLYTSRR